MWTIWYIPYDNKDYYHLKMIWMANTEEEAEELLSKYLDIELTEPSEEDWEIYETDTERFEKICREKYPNFNCNDGGYIVKLSNEKIDELFGHMPYDENTCAKFQFYEMENMKDYPEAVEKMRQYIY